MDQASLPEGADSGVECDPQVPGSEAGSEGRCLDSSAQFQVTSWGRNPAARPPSTVGARDSVTPLRP